MEGGPFFQRQVDLDHQDLEVTEAEAVLEQAGD
jgi:hypothetical protein